jgi:hypothetical protein
VSGTEGLAATGLVLLNRHLWITKPDDLFFAVLAGFHNKLLAAPGGALRLVAGHFGFVGAR